MASEVPMQTLKHEVQFYDETEKVQDDIEDFKDRLQSQNDEFNLLLEYYMQNKGRLDVYHGGPKGSGGSGAKGRMTQCNLGTRDESWYYLDERGNKVWVKNISLNAGAGGKGGSRGDTGAFCESGGAGKHDGKRIVVTVPKAKRSYGLQANYRRCTDEYDAYRHRVYAAGTDRPASAHSLHHGGHKVLTDSTGRPITGELPGASGAGGAQGHEEYIEFQQRLHKAVANSGAHTRIVSRPPASIEEAEARLAQLRAQEKMLRGELY